MNSNYQNQFFNMPYYYEQKNRQTTFYKRFIQGVLDFIGIGFCFIIYACLYLVKPREQYVTCDMSDITFPKLNDSVPLWAVILYGTLLPIILILLVEFWNSFENRFISGKRQRLRQFSITTFHGVSLFGFGLSIVLLLTEVGKRTVGRLRPHFLSVCNPDYTTIDCLQSAQTGSFFKSISTGGSFCRGNPADVEEARLSFPSGHTSFSVYAMLFIIIYLEARFSTLTTRYIKALLQIGVFSLSYYTSMSRIVDYAHRGTDVLGGAILGLVIALIITLQVGKVLWIYDRKIAKYEADMQIAN